MTKTLDQLPAWRRMAWNTAPTWAVSTFKLLFQPRSFLYSEKYLKTIISHKPVDAAGNPVPWFTYSAIDLLQSRLKPTTSVFEYGCGQSTLFFEKHAGRVTAVEHNPKWYEIVSTRVDKSKTSLILATDVASGDYASAILSQPEPFDVVVVDGVDRVACAKAALQRLSPEGMIILDDATRAEYQPAIEAITAEGFTRLSLFGLRPASPYFDRTDFFYRPGRNVLGL